MIAVQNGYYYVCLEEEGIYLRNGNAETVTSQSRIVGLCS